MSAGNHFRIGTFFFLHGKIFVPKNWKISISFNFLPLLTGWVTRTAGNRGYFPVFNRYLPFLQTNHLPDSQNSTDPFLYSIPKTSSSEKIPIETNRNPKVSFMQTGGGDQPDENDKKDKEGPVDELEEFQHNKIQLKALSDKEFQQEEQRGQKRSLECSETTEILESTSSVSQTKPPLKKKKKKFDPYQHYWIKGRDTST